MEDTSFQEENDIEEILGSGEEAPKKAKKVDPVGRSFYGDEFTSFMKIGEYQDLLPAFKQLYYDRMIADSRTKMGAVMKEFQDSLKDTVDSEGNRRYFWPYTNQVRIWKRKWDKDILEKKGMMLAEINTKKRVQQVMKTRASGDEGVVTYETPEYESLEQGLQTLGGELMNDAMQMLRDDQSLEDIYDSDELIKRKGYIVNVFANVTKMVHGKAALMLKASEEKRNNAGFLMELMKKASAGKLSESEIGELRSSYEVAPTEAKVVDVS